jgi:hypothetical protein
VGFVQHIKVIILLENGGQRNSQEEREKITKGLQKKKSGFVDSCVGVWAIKPNLCFSICNIKFVEYIKKIYFLENGGQRNSQEENEKKFKISQKKFLHRASGRVWTISQNL